MWTQSLDLFLKVLYQNDYKDIEKVIISYDYVRPKGERLKTFGGTASGHESLKDMFVKIDKVIKNRGNYVTPKQLYRSAFKSPDEKRKLRPIDCMDIANIIGENVVVGGVRRTSEVVLFDFDDEEIIQAKNDLYIQGPNGQLMQNKNISHREMSNNSVFYDKKPTRKQLHWQMIQMRYSGEPGFMNAEAARKRRPNLNGGNPLTLN